MKRLYLVVFKGECYVLAESEQQALEVARECNEGSHDWAAEAHGIFPEWKGRPAVGDPLGRKCQDLVGKEVE